MYVSSSMVFERVTEFPTTEEHLQHCPAPHSAYGFSKLAGEVYARAAHDEHGLRYTICRPFNAYGPGELPEPGEPGIAHAVPDLIFKALARQQPLEIFGSGKQTRTLTHVDDIADGIVVAMASPAGENQDFNISASRELTVAEIATLIWSACGNDPGQLELEHLPSFEVDVQRRWPSVEKARRLLGWEARVELEEGLAQTVQWLRDQPASQPGRDSATATLGSVDADRAAAQLELGEHLLRVDAPLRRERPRRAQRPAREQPHGRRRRSRGRDDRPADPEVWLRHRPRADRLAVGAGDRHQVDRDRVRGGLRRRARRDRDLFGIRPDERAQALPAAASRATA